MAKQFLECGKIVSTHGLKGEVRVQPWCDSPQYLCGFSTLYFDKGGKKIPVELARPQKNMVLLKLAGIDSLEQAVTLRGRILYIDRDDAPQDGKQFIQDLIGLAVRDADTGESYGTLSDVISTGANDVYALAGEDGRQRLVPAIPQVIVKTDLEAGEMLIRPLEGLFEE